jgi:hypothetical protein
VTAQIVKETSMKKLLDSYVVNVVKVFLTENFSASAPGFYTVLTR